MLLHNDVVTDGKTEPSSFPGRLGRKERVEQLFLNLRRNTGAIVANSDFDAVTEVLGRRSQRRLVVTSICLRVALSGRIEPVGDQVEQHPRDLLREQIYLASGRVKGPFQGDVEALLFSPCPVVGEVETFIDQGIDINRPVLARALTRMQQH